jgi:hypothetical protein
VLLDLGLDVALVADSSRRRAEDSVQVMDHQARQRRNALENVSETGTECQQQM